MNVNIEPSGPERLLAEIRALDTYIGQMIVKARELQEHIRNTKK
jgi:hypothetical protein